MNNRLHSVLLTLWDIARDNPNYNRKLWGELQHHLSQLQTRNTVLCELLADLLHCTDDSGNILWEKSSVHSPPQGYAVKFMREELQRLNRSQLRKPVEVIPTDRRGQAIDPEPCETVVRAKRPAPHTTTSAVEECLIDGLEVDGSKLNHSPIGVGDEYDVGDESDELAVDFSSSDDLIL